MFCLSGLGLYWICQLISSHTTLFNLSVEHYSSYQKNTIIVTVELANACLPHSLMCTNIFL
jgi:hypothetical protein